MRRIAIYLLLMCMAAGILAGCEMKTDKESEPEFVLTYADNQSEDHPALQGAYKFAELVKERTNGKVIVRIYENGELGTQEEVVEQLQFGGIDLTRVSVSAISDELPRMNIFQLPFLYETEEQMWSILDSQTGQTFLRSLEMIDLVGLSWYEAGTRNFYSVNEPITCVEDLREKRIRVQESEVMKDWITMLGGTPVSVPYTDVYEALELENIDVAENNLISYSTEKHYEVAKYYTVNEHACVPDIQIMSRNTWDNLPPAYRHIISSCAKESAEYEKELWKDYEEQAKWEAIEEGCILVEWSEEELTKCKEMVLPLYEKHYSVFMYLIEDIRNNEFYERE